MHHTSLEIRDENVELPIHDSAVVFSGAVWDVRADEFDYPGQHGLERLRREYVQHTGSVAIAALNDDNELLLIQQYRHPVRQKLWEIPAGLLDQDGEPMLAAAQRELAEEADLVAEHWHTLIDCYTSPGGQDEACRIFLATGLSYVPEADRHQRSGEEFDLNFAWVALDHAADLVYAGKLHNPFTIMSVLALNGAGQQRLRPADAPWTPTRARG